MAIAESGASHVVLPMTALHDDKSAKQVNLRLVAGEIAVQIEAYESFAQPRDSSYLSALRSKTICDMEGNFMSKGAPRMGEVKHVQPGTRSSQQVPERLSGPPLPIKTFLHTHTWHTKDPKAGEQFSLEFDIKHAGIAVITHKWNPSIDWTSRIAKEDLLKLYQKRVTLEATLHALGLGPTKLPTSMCKQTRTSSIVDIRKRWWHFSVVSCHPWRCPRVSSSLSTCRIVVKPAISSV